MITIRVRQRDTGEPVGHARVSLYFSGISGGVTDEHFTDARGEAHFDYAPSEGVIYVEGKEIGSRFLEKIVEVQM